MDELKKTCGPDYETMYHDVIEEAKYMKAENEELRKFAHDMEKKFSVLDGERKELADKVKFLEGQVEAYQYCMNVRRL